MTVFVVTDKAQDGVSVFLYPEEALLKVTSKRDYTSGCFVTVWGAILTDAEALRALQDKADVYYIIGKQRLYTIVCRGVEGGGR